MTCSCVLDYCTIAAADKFGNIAIVSYCFFNHFFSARPCILQLRLPSDVSDEVDEDPTGSKAIWDRGLLSGASQKVVFLVCQHSFEYILCLG